jgi:nucleoside-diphosphate-sugar epimerase
MERSREGEKEKEREGEIEGKMQVKEEEGQFSILILGGCGFVGRNLLLFLLNEKLVKYVKIVDKVTPVMAYLHPLHMTSYQSSLVEFQQADLTKSDHLDRIFRNRSFDFVFNLASETRSGQPEHVYASRCSDLSYLCALKSAECGVKRFIEVEPSINFCCP